LSENKLFYKTFSNCSFLLFLANLVKLQSLSSKGPLPGENNNILIKEK